MSRNSSQQGDKVYQMFNVSNENGSNLVGSPSIIARSQEQQQEEEEEEEKFETPRNNIIRIPSSQPIPFAFWSEGMSLDTINREENITNELFNKIEQLICDYMQPSQRHYLHCRILRWCLEEDQSRMFSAVIVINPPSYHPHYA